MKEKLIKLVVNSVHVDFDDFDEYVVVKTEDLGAVESVSEAKKLAAKWLEDCEFWDPESDMESFSEVKDEVTDETLKEGDMKDIMHVSNVWGDKEFGAVQQFNANFAVICFSKGE